MLPGEYGLCSGFEERSQSDKAEDRRDLAGEFCFPVMKMQIVKKQAGRNGVLRSGYNFPSSHDVGKITVREFKL